MAFVRSYNPIWNFRDLTGLPLDDTYYAFFLENVLPYAPQAPFRDLNGTAVWTGGIVQFSAAGTLPDNLYFDDSLVYRIEIRQGNMSSDPLIWLIENYVPASAGGGTSPTATNIVSSNQITNPEFVDRFFTDGYTTSDNLVEIAPGWQFVGTGGGTVTFNLVDLSGASNVPLQPAFALRITTSGKSTAVLRQRIDNNGALFQTGGSANSAIGTSLLAIDNLGGSPILSVDYLDSNGTLINLINSTYTGAWDNKLNSVPLPNSSPNPDLNSVAYVDIDISLPGTGDVSVSAVQIVKQIVPDTTNLQYQGQTPARQRDHTWHYYRNSVLTMPKNDILSGWNFAQNPWQFRSVTSATLTSQTAYTADQTIVHQQTSANNIAIGQAPTAERNGFQVTAVTANNRFALIQYIDAATIRPYWNYFVSSLVRARIFTTHGSNIRFKMRLISRTSFPPTIGATEPIASWSGSNDPVFSAGWSEILPKNDPVYTLPNAYDPTQGAQAFPAFSFDGFQLPVNGASGQTLGIVIYTLDPMVQTGTADRIVFDRISLVPNDFAIDATPLTFDETLRRCQFYYEKSYRLDDLPGTISDAGAQTRIIVNVHNGGTTTNTLHGKSFSFDFQQTKRAIPSSSNVILYGITTGNIDRITAWLYSNTTFLVPKTNVIANNWNGSFSNGAAFYEIADTSTALVSVVGAAPAETAESMIGFHYTIDTRLGV